MKALILTPVAVAISAALAGPVFAADPAKIDWGKVPSRTVTLFYPGQSTYQWLRGSGHPGAQVVNTGGACLTCHKGAEQKLGDKLVKGGPLEPMPVKGKNGTVDLKFQAAYDAKNAYLRFQWKTLNPYPGTEHQYLRFDGKEWKQYGYPKLDDVVQQGKQPGIYEDRFSIMIDDGSVRDDYLERHPSAREWSSFGDFGFYRMEVVDAYYIAGFGEMAWVSADDYRKAKPDPLAAHAEAIIAHMNADHADSLALYCRAFAGVEADSALMEDVDYLGFRVRAQVGDERHDLRISFPRPARTPKEVRAVLVDMSRKARSASDS